MPNFTDPHCRTMGLVILLSWATRELTFIQGTTFHPLIQQEADLLPMLVLRAPGLQVLPNLHVWMKLLPTKPLTKARKMTTKMVEMKMQVDDLVLKMEVKVPAMKLASLPTAIIPVVSARSYSSPND